MGDKIELGKKDCAIVFFEDGTFSAFLPEHENENDLASTGEMLVIGIAGLVSKEDKRLIDLVKDFFIEETKNNTEVKH